jgi:hypothetical protein
MKQTAVEWLGNELVKKGFPIEKYGMDLFEQAKEMEKQKLEQFYNHGQWAIIEHGHGESFQDYYNQTFKQDK